MPIKGLTESRRLPRLGKIHLGIKKQAKSGAWYPSATEYFVVPPEVAEVVGEKPIELPIIFPIEDDEKFASQFYRSYSMTRGLVCRGDGETCRRMVDAQTGEMANRNSTEITWRDGLPCEGRDCPYYGKQCKEVMNLQFLLPTVEGLGIWQIDTSSINSIRNINSGIELIRGVYGRIAMIPLLLTLEPIEVTNPDDGKKKKVRVLNLRTKGTMIELMERAIKPAREMLLPAPLDTEAPEDMEPVPNGEEPKLPTPDEQPPELIMPQNQEPANQEQAEKDTEELWPEDMRHPGTDETQTGAAAPLAKVIPEEANWRVFWEYADQLGLSRDRICEMLEVTSVKEWTDQGKTLDEAIRVISGKFSQLVSKVKGEPPPTPPVPTSKLDFDPDWLLDSLKRIHWRDTTVKSWLGNHYKVDLAGTITDIVARLTKDERREFFKEILDRMQMV